MAFREGVCVWHLERGVCVWHLERVCSVCGI